MDLPRLSPSAQAIMAAAAAESNRRGHRFLGVDHVFAAFGKTKPSRLAHAMTRQHLDAGRFEWIASVHPYRRDAVAALGQAVRNGARAVKWLPAAQGMDPDEARKLVAGIWRGNAETLLRLEGAAFEALIAGVATPGGLTEQGRATLGEAGAFAAWDQALDGLLARLRKDWAER